MATKPEQMTPEQAEKWVRERWPKVDFHPLYGVTIYSCAMFKGGMISRHFSNALAAAEYTRQHEQKIAEKREEIEWLKDCRVHPSDLDKPLRILAVLESQYAELLRGWRQQ